MSIIIMLLLLSLLIIIHEFGHFIAAKSFGIKVDKFGFGLPLGPTLFKKEIGGVTFLVHALLLGGYVSFAEDDKDCDLPLDSPERFSVKPVWQRFIVVSAGVFANVICAFLLVLFSSLVWHYLPSDVSDVTVEQIVAPKDASVWQSGLRVNDRIVSINSIEVKNLSTVLAVIQLSKASDGFVSPDFVEYNLKRLKKLNPGLVKDEIIPPEVVIRLPEFQPESTVVFDKNVARGVKPYKHNQVHLSLKHIKLRDMVGNLSKNTYFVSNGQYTLYDLAYAMSDTYRPVNFEVERNGKILKLNTMYPSKAGVLGIQMSSKQRLKHTDSFPQAVVTSSHFLVENTYLMLVGLKQVFTGEVKLTDLHGIVAITKVGGDVIQNRGLFYGLLLTAIISMNLAIVNFLPIPALDGGHVLFLIIEKITGKKVSEKVLEVVANICFTLLIVLMIFVIFNDIFALITQKL